MESVPLCGVASPLLRARGFHVANLQADADLHTFSGHHRDAVHDMRRADAACTDRAARPQLQSLDLSLRALRFRRELFKVDVSRRHFDWARSLREKSRAQKKYAEACGAIVGLFAGELRRRMVENPGPRNLRRNQKCRNDGRHTDQSQKLIHRKHGCPPKPVE